MGVFRRNMRLFGQPYQFTSMVDPRISDISSEIGRKYIDNILMDAPIITIIPGSPKYINDENSNTTMSALLQASSDNFAPIKEKIGNGDTNDFRYYDFQRNYTDYMSYVNILCRSCASFLELEDVDIDGKSLIKYDWRNYRNNADNYKAAGGGSIWNKFTAGSGDSGMAYETYTETDKMNEYEDGLTGTNFVQFYCDPSVQANESMSNETSESKFKGIFDSVSNDVAKELNFITNSAGAGDIYNSMAVGTDDITSEISNAVSSMDDSSGALTNVFGRIFSVAGNVIKGENVIMPKIYQSSSYQKQYDFTVHLKAPYGNRLGYYLDVCVPLMHLIALGLPKQTTANTYGSPFLVKAYVDGVFTCNMGIVTNININKSVSETSWTADGLPNEVDVTITIEDLYSDLSMSPQSSPILFANNSSLVEYLATTCGLSITTPNLEKKAETIIDSLRNAVTDTPGTVNSMIRDVTEQFSAKWFSITGR